MEIKKGKLYKITSKCVEVGVTYGFGESKFTALTNQVIFSPSYDMDLSTYPKNKSINIYAYFGVSLTHNLFVDKSTSLRVGDTIEEADVSDYFILNNALRKSNSPYFFDLKSKKLRLIPYYSFKPSEIT